MDLKTENVNQLYHLFVTNNWDKPIRISIIDEEIITYIPPKKRHHMIYILKPIGCINVSYLKSDGKWHDIPFCQMMPFRHGYVLSIKSRNEEENKKQQKDCGLTQANLTDFKQKFIVDGICMVPKGDGSFCNCAVKDHVDDSDWTWIKQGVSKLLWVESTKKED